MNESSHEEWKGRIIKMTIFNISLILSSNQLLFCVKYKTYTYKSLAN